MARNVHKRCRGINDSTVRLTYGFTRSVSVNGVSCCRGYLQRCLRPTHLYAADLVVSVQSLGDGDISIDGENILVSVMKQKPDRRTVIDLSSFQVVIQALVERSHLDPPVDGTGGWNVLRVVSQTWTRSGGVRQRGTGCRVDTKRITLG